MMQIVSGRLKQAMSVLPHSTGVAVVFASLLSGSKRFTVVVVKVKMLCGVQFSENNGCRELGYACDIYRERM